MRVARLYCQELTRIFDFGSVTLRPFGWRRIDLPQGASPPPARLFVVCKLWRGFLAFSLSAIGAISSVLDWSSAAFGVSGGSLGSSWGALGGLLEPLWALLGGSGGLLGTSWGVLEAIQNNIEITCKKDQLPDPSTQFPPRLWGSILGSKIDQKQPQNEPKI